jgi:hypothetical protein
MSFYNYYPFNEIYEKLGPDITDLILKMASFDFKNYKYCKGYDCEKLILKKGYNHCKECFNKMKKEGCNYCYYCDNFTITCCCEEIRNEYWLLE